MGNFVDLIKGLLSDNGFIEFPTRRRKLKSRVVVMAIESKLAIILGPFHPSDDTAPIEVIQDEFDDYLERDILPIVEYYEKGFRLHDVKLVMQSGGKLQVPYDLGPKGIEVVPGLEAKDICLDFPGIGKISL